MKRLNLQGLAALRARQFRLLFGGQLASLLGDQATYVALPFAVLAVTGSVSDVGFVIGAAFVPQVAFLLLGGVVGDQLPRRRVMLLADLVRFGAQGSVAALLLAGQAQLWHLVLAQAIHGTASAFFLPASTGLLPQLVEKERLQGANALLNLAKATSVIVAAAMSGIVVAAAGPGYALAADAVSFLVSAAFLARLDLPRTARQLELRSVAGDLLHGWRELTSRRWVWAFIVWGALLNALVIAPLQVLGPFVAHRSLGGATAWGTIVAAMGVGSLLGGVLAMSLRPRRPLLLAALAFAALAPELFLLAVPAPTLAIAAAGVAGGASFVVSNVLWETTLQQRIPESVMSRVSAYDWFGSLALLPLGLALAGPVSGLVGVSGALWLSGGFLLVSIVVLLAGVRDVRGLDERVEPEPAEALAPAA